MHCYEIYCTHFCLTTLQILNCIDALFSFILIFIGIYVYDKVQPLKANFNIIVQLMPVCTIMLGVILISQVFLSYCAAATPGCRCLSTKSAYLSIVAAVCSLSLAVSSYIYKIAIFNCLNEHGTDDLHLLPPSIKALEANYDTFICALVAITCMQLLRYCIYISFQNSLYQSEHDGHEIQLHDKELNGSYPLLSSNTQTNITTAAEQRHEKYQELKKHYHDKYAKLGATVTSNDTQELNEVPHHIVDVSWNTHHDMENTATSLTAYQYTSRIT